MTSKKMRGHLPSAGGVFRSGSILMSIFAVLLLLAVGILLLFTHYVSKTYQKEYRYEVLHSRFAVMENAAVQLDAEVARRLEQMKELIHSQDCGRLMVSSDITQNRLGMDIALSLSSLVQSQDTVDQAWLYFSQSDCVLSSDQELLVREGSRYDSFLEAYWAVREGSGLPQREQAQVLTLNNRLYLVVDYPTSTPLVTMVVRLDQENLYQKGVSELWEDGLPKLLVYDRKGNPVFPGQAEYPRRDMLLVGEEEQWNDCCSVYRSADYSSQLLLTCQGEESGMVLVLPMGEGELTPVGGDWLWRLVPYMLLTGVFTLLASLYLLKKVCLPVQRVMDSILRGRVNEGADHWPGGQLELAQDLVEDDRKQRERMQAMLLQVQDSVREKLLLSLLQDGPVEAQDMERLFDDEQMPPVNGRYGVLYVEWQPGQPAPGEAEAIVYDLHLSALVEEYWKPLCTSYRVSVSATQTAWILRFPQEYPENRMEEDVEQLRRRLAREVHLLSCRCEIGASGVCPSLSGLKQEYEAARQQAQYRLYYRDETKTERDSVKTYRGRVSQALQNLVDKTNEEGFDWDGLVDEIVSSHPEQGAKLFRMVMDLLIEQMIMLQIEPEEQWNQLRRTISSGGETVQPGDERIDWVKNFIRLSVETIRGLKSSRQHQRIARAKAYIMEHFSESSLSLEQVSSQIGTTGPYLSYLFSSYLSCGFLDYLNQYRIEQAKKLLVSTDLTVGEVGFKVGFNSPQYFIRVFKKYVQDTPGHYRTKAGGRGT